MAVPLIMREWLVMVPLILHHLAIGFVLAFPAVLTPALTANGTDIHATKDEASWIAASYSMTGSIGFFILPTLMQIYGRKFINALLNFIILVGWVFIAFAPNVITLIAGRAFQGLAFGGLYISSILAAEYSHPKRRGFFVIFKIAATGIGELICHGFGFSMTWRKMVSFAAIPPTLAILGTLFWPESPSWLAYKGRFEDAVINFEWLRGDDFESKKELSELITAQTEMRNIKKMNKKGRFMKTVEAMRSREFLKPFTIVIVLAILTQVCGRHYLLAYVVQIMVNLTGDASKAYYYTIGLDVMKIVAIFLSSIVVRMIKRRTLLFVSGGLACFVLGLMCVIHYLVGKGLMGASATWTPLLLITYNIICHIGVIPVSMVYKGELFPLEYKGIGVTSVGVIYSLSSMALLKLTSVLLDTIETHGTFGVYLIIAIACLIWLYFVLPETKDRTLQDIEMDFLSINLPSRNVVIEQDTTLVQRSK